MQRPSTGSTEKGQPYRRSVIDPLSIIPSREARRVRHSHLHALTDEVALDAHARLNSTRPPLLPERRRGSGEREDDEYHRRR